MLVVAGFGFAWAGDPEVAAHLMNVVEVLRAETPSDLPPEVRQRRLGMLEALENYAAAGLYPVHPGGRSPRARVVEPERGFLAYDAQRAPLFVDPAGTHCAVGYLMAVDRPDLVARVVAEANDAYLLEMSVPGVAAWAAWAGFTTEELAWIQPRYATEVPECPDDTSASVFRRPLGAPDPDPCGDLAVRISEGQRTCEVCGEGHRVPVVVRNIGTVSARGEVVVRAADGREIGRSTFADLRPNLAEGLMVSVANWEDVVEAGAVASVEVPGNCAAPELVSVEIITENNGPPLSPPRCGGCDVVRATSGWSLLAGVALLAGALRRRIVKTSA